MNVHHRWVHYVKSRTAPQKNIFTYLIRIVVEQKILTSTRSYSWNRGRGEVVVVVVVVEVISQITKSLDQKKIKKKL